MQKNRKQEASIEKYEAGTVGVANFSTRIKSANVTSAKRK